MFVAYALASALVTAASLHEWISGSKHWIASIRLKLHARSLAALCDERLGWHALPPLELFIPESIHVQRLTEWPPLRMRSAWPGCCAVPRAP